MIGGIEGGPFPPIRPSQPSSTGGRNALLKPVCDCKGPPGANQVFGRGPGRDEIRLEGEYGRVPGQRRRWRQGPGYRRYLSRSWRPSRRMFAVVLTQAGAAQQFAVDGHAIDLDDQLVDVSTQGQGGQRPDIDLKIAEDMPHAFRQSIVEPFTFMW